MKILLAGDSTVATCPTHEYPMSGWGAHLAPHVYTWAQSTTSPRAVPARSPSARRASGRQLLEVAGEGDLVLIQFGHNDQKKPPPRGQDRLRGQPADNGGGRRVPGVPCRCCALQWSAGISWTGAAVGRCPGAEPGGLSRSGPRARARASRPADRPQQLDARAVPAAGRRGIQIPVLPFWARGPRPLGLTGSRTTRTSTWTVPGWLPRKLSPSWQLGLASRARRKSDGGTQRRRSAR